jgi:hypothetical protein
LLYTPVYNLLSAQHTSASISGFLAKPNTFELHLHGNNMIVEELLEIKTGEVSELREMGYFQNDWRLANLTEALMTKALLEQQR